MSNAKKKSSGWRPSEKRRPWPERKARQIAARTAEARLDCNRLGLWRYCPIRPCRRVRGCAGDPGPCLEERRRKAAENCNDLARPQGAAAAPASAADTVTPPGPVLSAAEAAAAIAASIADPAQGAPLPGEELEAIVRDGRIHYEPRRRR